MKIVYEHTTTITMTKDEAEVLRINMEAIARAVIGNIAKSYTDFMTLLPQRE